MVTTTIRMPHDLYMKLKKAAKERGISVNGMIVNTLFEILKEK